jgi:hypothetical protein
MAPAGTAGRIYFGSFFPPQVIANRRKVGIRSRKLLGGDTTSHAHWLYVFGASPDGVRLRSAAASGGGPAAPGGRIRAALGTRTGAAATRERAAPFRRADRQSDHPLQPRRLLLDRPSVRLS